MANSWLKIVSILLISTVYLVSFTHIGVMAYDTFLKKGSFKPGTQIASIQLENMTKTQAEKELEEKVAAWFAEENLQLLIKGEKVVINEFFFTFDFPATIERVNDGKGNEFVVHVNQDVYEADLKSVLQDQYEAIDHDLIQSTLIKSVNNMLSEKQYFTVEAFMRDDVDTIAAENTLTASFNQEDVQKVLTVLGEVKVPAQSQISFLELIGTSTNLSQDSLHIVSSAIYKTLLLTNFIVVERQTSVTLPKHIELGYEVFIDPDTSDFKWFNPNETAYTLTFDLKNDHLNVKVNGTPFLQNYRVKFEDKTSYSPKTIVRYTSLLDEGEEVVKQAGQEGLLVKVFREVYDGNDVLVASEQISEDFYPPAHRVIETGLINRMVENAIKIVDEGSSQSLDDDSTNSMESSESNQSSEEQVNDKDGNEPSETETSATQRDGLWETPTEALEK